MASTRKSYFLAPSWDIKPAEVALGSAIANIRSPERPMSDAALVNAVDSEIHSVEDTDCSGTIKDGKKWSVGLFATFVHMITLGGEASYASSTSSEMEYSCKSMETRRFTPSTAYISKMAADPAVKSHLKVGGIGAKVFVVTGVKTAKDVTITTTEDTSTDTTVQIGTEIPAAQITVGPKVTFNPTTHRTHTKTIAGPIVFAFQVEKLRVNRKDAASSKPFISGAFLGQADKKAEYVIERAGEGLDEDDLDDFGVEASSGLDDNGEECQIITIAME